MLNVLLQILRNFFVFLAFNSFHQKSELKIVTFNSRTLYRVELGYNAMKGTEYFVSL
jgi:hypothetical protein